MVFNSGFKGLKPYYFILSISSWNLSGLIDNNGREIRKFLQSVRATSGILLFEITSESFIRFPQSYELPLLTLLLLLSNINVCRSTKFSQTHSTNFFFPMKVTRISRTYKIYEIIVSYIRSLLPEYHKIRVLYTGCPRRKGQNFGRVFLMLKYTDITQNTYIQS